MSNSQPLSESIAISWSQSIADYFKKSGGMDASRPVALVLEKHVAPHDDIAFCFDNEIQIKGPCMADNVVSIFIDTDLGNINPAYTGETFRKWAKDAKVAIINDD